MKEKATRRSPRGERSRSVILRAASEEFAAKGYRSASLAAIAERAGMTQSGLLHHYPTKDQLLEAVLLTRFSEDARLLDEVAAETTSLPLSGYRLLAERNAQNVTWVRLLTILSAEGLTDDHPSRAAMSARHERVRARVRSRVDRQADLGLVRDDLDRDVLASLLVAAMDGLQLHWLYDPRIDMAAAMEMLTALVVPNRTGPADAETPSSAGAMTTSR